ncbi:hypothetical protein PR048_003216 [Dryococelus australis]|uniref:Uncharacterized protein n=1 Tax=Dryococelus australis TaxID=614101 RepID=A0ABQ9IPM2_9NEOP|nr:hypothetical protein PR048_003216 [Dryococelus australis]
MRESNIQYGECETHRYICRWTISYVTPDSVCLWRDVVRIDRRGDISTVHMSVDTRAENLPGTDRGANSRSCAYMSDTLRLSYEGRAIVHHAFTKVKVLFDTSWRTLAESSPSTVTADNQYTVDIDKFVHKTVESRLQMYRLSRDTERGNKTLSTIGVVTKQNSAAPDILLTRKLSVFETECILVLAVKIMRAWVLSSRLITEDIRLSVGPCGTPRHKHNLGKEPYSRSSPARECSARPVFASPPSGPRGLPPLSFLIRCCGRDWERAVGGASVWAVSWSQGGGRHGRRAGERDWLEAVRRAPPLSEGVEQRGRGSDPVAGRWGQRPAWREGSDPVFVVRAADTRGSPVSRQSRLLLLWGGTAESARRCDRDGSRRRSATARRQRASPAARHDASNGPAAAAAVARLRPVYPWQPTHSSATPTRQPRSAAFSTVNKCVLVSETGNTVEHALISQTTRRRSFAAGWRPRFVFRVDWPLGVIAPTSPLLSETNPCLRKIISQISECTYRLPPRRIGFDSRWGRSPDFGAWESCSTIPLVDAVFSGISRFSPPLRSDAAPYSPRFTHIGSPAP